MPDTSWPLDYVERYVPETLFMAQRLSSLIRSVWRNHGRSFRSDRRQGTLLPEHGLKSPLCISNPAKPSPVRPCRLQMPAFSRGSGNCRLLHGFNHCAPGHLGKHGVLPDPQHFHSLLGGFDHRGTLGRSRTEKHLRSPTSHSSLLFPIAPSVRGCIRLHIFRSTRPQFP